MNARFVMLMTVVSMVALTGCSGLGNNIFGVGAPCGPGCFASTAPAYDYGPGPVGHFDDCGCGTDAYSGYNTGIIPQGGFNSFGPNPGFDASGDGWQGVPQPGQYSDGGYVVPNSAGTNMVPTPILPQPST